MIKMQPYADLEIRILECQDAGYPVEIDLNHRQYYKRGYLDPSLPTWDDRQQTGACLFAWLFEDRILKEAWEYVRGQYPRRHIRLRLDAGVPELHALPWESLCDPATGLDLAATDATPFSRFLAGEWMPGSAVLSHPLKILVAIANPCNLSDYGLTELDAEAEWDTLQSTTEGLDVQLTRLLSPCSLSALETELRQGYHILHLIAHGEYNQRQNQAALYLVDAANYVTPVTEADFALILKRQLADNAVQNDARLRLVFLASCESATRDTADAFRGLAPALVEAGVPAVVAMQDSVSISTAREFSRTFYRQLLQHGLVDLAGNQARAALLAAGSFEAATPVVFMRLPDGKLWETVQAFAPARRDFYAHAPRLEAERYVNRPREYAQIKILLLADPATEGLTTALCGAGGFGKTTLARVLCDDAEVQARFADGILWATLGENPDLLARLREWVTVLGGVISENAPTIPQLVDRLTDMLRDGAYLLLIDDVWDSVALTPFLCGGPRCGHLVTTRKRTTLPAGAQLVAIDTMHPAEAVALLGYGLDAAAEMPEAASLQALAERLGNWPLLLGIINGVLRETCVQGASVTEALAYVAEGLDAEGLTVFDAADTTERTRAVRATMEVSLYRLSDAERTRYAELAIFPEKTDIPATAAARLWGQMGGLSAFKTKDLFRRLGSASLVQTYDAERQTVRLHDVVRVYLASVLGPEGCAAAHRALLDTYRQTVTLSLAEGSPTPWPTAPDDGYLYAHLAYHLDALAVTDADAAAELASLFATDAWLQARVAADGYTYDGYLADLEYAWRRAEVDTRRQIAAGVPPDALTECVRCALIRTTVNSLAGSYAPEMVVRAVESDLWSPARALSIAAKMPEPEQRSQTYALLLEMGALTRAQREAARSGGLAAARTIQDGEYRAQALAALAPQLTGAVREQALAEGLAAARAIEHWRDQAELSVLLVSHYTGVARDQALAEMASTDEHKRARALAALAPQLTGAVREQALAEGLAAVRAIRDEGGLAQVALAQQLTGALSAHSEVLERVFAIGTAVQVFAALAPQLTGMLLTEELAAARAVKDEYLRAEALATLAPQLTGAVREQALAEGLAAARAIEDEGYRAIALAALASHLTGVAREQTLTEGLAAARAIEYEGYRANALATLAPQLTGAVREQALVEGLAAARVIEDPKYRVWVLKTLVPQLTGAMREQVLAEGLAAARAIEYEGYRASALAALAPQLMGKLLEEELAAARAIEDEKDRVQVLAALVPRWRWATQAIWDITRAVKALAALWFRIISAAREQALANKLAAARAIEDKRDRVQVLAALAPQLTEAVREQALAEGLAAACAIEDKWYRSRALAALAPQLMGKLLKEGLAAARAIEDEEYRAKALVALAPQLTGVLLAEGLAAARTIEDEWDRAEVLAALIPRFAGAAAQPVRKEYQAVILVALHADENATREKVLRLLANKDVFKPDALGLTPAAVSRIVEAVVDICRRWEWV